MERIYEETNEIPFKCPQCENTEFIQDVFCLGHERVNLINTKDGIKIISLSMDKVLSDDIEYQNYFICSKCKYGTTIEITDGKEHFSL